MLSNENVFMVLILVFSFSLYIQMIVLWTLISIFTSKFLYNIDLKTVHQVCCGNPISYICMKWIIK